MAFAPRPEFALPVLLVLVAIRFVAVRAVLAGRRPTRVLAFAAVLFPMLVYACAPSPTAWLPVLPPIIAVPFLLRLRRGLPWVLLLVTGTAAGLLAAGTEAGVMLGACTSLLTISFLIFPLAAELNRRQGELQVLATEAERNAAFNELLLQTNPNLIYVKDEDSRMIKVNEAFADFAKDADVDSLLGYRYLAPYDEATRQALLAGDRAAFQAGASVSEVVLPQPKGDRVLILNKTIFRGPDGARYLLGTGIDVTDERQAAHTAREAQAARQRVLDAMNDGLWELDRVEDRVSFSPRFRELLGYDKSDRWEGPSTPRGLLSVVHPEDVARVLGAFRAHVQHKAVFDIEVRLRTKAGVYRHFRGRAKAELDPDGAVLRLVGAIEDIEESKLQEQALVVAKQEALAAVEAKSAFLANMSHEIRTPMNGVLGMLQILADTPLEDSQRQQVAFAEQSASSLLGIINDILDLSKMEAGKLAIEKTVFDLRRVLGEATENVASTAQGKGLDLVLDMHDVPQGTVRGDPVRIRQVLINLLSNALKFTQDGEIFVQARLLEDHEGLLFMCSVSDTGIGIESSKLDGLFQAFTQADASTTRNYGGTGLGLSISRQLCELMGGALHAESQVGTGSTFSFEVRLVERDASASEPPFPSRLGFGLVDPRSTRRAAVVRQLEAWGGRTTAWADLEELSSSSELGELQLLLLDEDVECDREALATELSAKGFTGKLAFLVSLSELTRYRERAVAKPMSDRAYWELAGALGRTQRGPVEGPPQVRLDGVRVLLVEDNRVNQMVARRLLSKQGAEVRVASDGVEALECLREAGVDVVLMDCQMPRMDGFAAARAIRAGQAGGAASTVPIVALTANALAGDRERCLEAGMNDFLTKPFRMEALTEVIRAMIA